MAEAQPGGLWEDGDADDDGWEVADGLAVPATEEEIAWAWAESG